MTTARFLHTADWQLGKPFAGVADPHNRALLQQERLAVIARIADLVREKSAQFVLIAGDLFDSPAATRAIVAAACAAIGKIGVPVLVIPGNHDHGGPGSLWEQAFFLREREALAPNLRVLLSPELLALDSAVIFPCPLLRRHEATDPTSWLRGHDFAGAADRPRVVIAHGSVLDFREEDSAPNRLDLARLPMAGIDYVALGDWHGTKQVAERAWYCGTPEQDRFARGEGNEPGHVLIVDVDRGGQPRVERVRTSRIGWHRHQCEFAEDADLERLEREIGELLGSRAQQDLLELQLRGTLGIGARTRLAQFLEAWEARLLRLDLVDEIRLAPSADEIAALTQRAGDPLIARVATQLLERAAGDGDAAETARRAIRELHALCVAA